MSGDRLSRLRRGRRRARCSVSPETDEDKRRFAEAKSAGSTGWPDGRNFVQRRS
jgi:hypothetical protein